MAKTIEALKRFSKLQDIGCICCRKKGRTSMAQIHHIVGQGPRSDMKTIPLCPHHHQGIPIGLWGKRETRALLGPSLRDQKKKFVEMWGTEMQLLKEVNEMLA